MNFRLLITLVAFFLSTTFVHADNYYVTSNADAGSGTLREAIALTNDHAGQDSIKFNLPGTDVMGRTITIDSVLPAVTDPLVIDGVSQTGNVFGTSLAKVQLAGAITLDYGIWLSADSCSIYGMFIQNFVTGVLVSGSYNQIGAVTKGNTIFNCSDACIAIVEADHVAMLSNLIGIDTAQQVGSLVGIGINVDNSQIISIGGRSSEGRNIISGNTNGVNMISAKFVNMNANYIGTDVSGTFAIPNSYGIYAVSNNLNVEIGGDSLFESNLVSGNTYAGIYGQFANSVLQANLIGVDKSGNNPLGNGTYGIYFGSASNGVLIGGTQAFLPNRIAYNGSEAIYFEDNTCQKISVIRNLAYCNSQSDGQGGYRFNGGNDGIQPPQILIANSDGIIGLAPAGYQVDLYIDDTCQYCEGRTLLGSVISQDNGLFEFSGNNIAGNVTAVMTDLNGNSSEFTGCVPATSDICLIPDFIAPEDSVCSYTPIQFLDASITKPGTDLSGWNWDFGDGNSSSDQNPSHAYMQGGDYTVTLTVTNTGDCIEQISKTISILSAPSPAFTYSTPVCAGAEITFTDGSTVSEGDSIIAWHWNFGDGGGTSQQNPHHTFDTAGDYTILFTVTGLTCEVDYTQDIHVGSAPVALFDNPEFACVGSSVQFEDQSTIGGDEVITSWLWDFGDGNTSEEQNPQHTYSQSGLFNLTLIVTSDNGCATSQTGIIMILNLPDAAFSFEQAGLAVTFTNASSDNGASSYTWDFGDGNSSTEENPVHQYASGGVYTACLTIFDSTCSATDSVCQIVDLPTGINDLSGGNVLIYPNPADDMLMMDGIPESVTDVFRINALGQRDLVYTSNTKSNLIKLYTATWQQGIYALEFFSGGNPIGSRKIQIIH